MSDTSKTLIGSIPLGAPPWPTVDPFLFCVHHLDFYPAGNEKMGPAASLAGRNIGMDFEGKDGWRMYHGDQVPGFPQHPHRGFETLTLARQGFIDHSDSLGATARFGQGDAQWMTAGRGIVHCEMFPLVEQDKPNTVELFQLWLNLPRADKMAEPHFSMFWSHTIPKITKRDNNGNETLITVVAGELDGQKAPTPPPHSWGARAESDLAVWTLQLQANAELSLPAAQPGSRRVLYFFEGDTLELDGQTFRPATALEVQADRITTLKNGADDGQILMLQGRPIDEPVAQHGPFVMNTRQELQQAFFDYHKTQFGGWPWKGPDPVHPRHAGRFAKHADGRVEQLEAKEN